MTDSKAAADSTAPAPSKTQTAKPSPAPLTRKQILEKLAQAVREKQAAQVAAGQAKESFEEQAANVVRAWLDE